jgi:hypothetical protein
MLFQRRRAVVPVVRNEHRSNFLPENMCRSSTGKRQQQNRPTKKLPDIHDTHYGHRFL